MNLTYTSSKTQPCVYPCEAFDLITPSTFKMQPAIGLFDISPEKEHVHDAGQNENENHRERDRLRSRVF